MNILILLGVVILSGLAATVAVTLSVRHIERRNMPVLVRSDGPPLTQDLAFPTEFVIRTAGRRNIKKTISANRKERHRIERKRRRKQCPHGNR